MQDRHREQAQYSQTFIMGLTQFGTVLIFISWRNTTERMHKIWISIPFFRQKKRKPLLNFHISIVIHYGL
jgi:hypothetical protein